MDAVHRLNGSGLPVMGGLRYSRTPRETWAYTLNPRSRTPARVTADVNGTGTLTGVG